MVRSSFRGDVSEKFDYDISSSLRDCDFQNEIVALPAWLICVVSLLGFGKEIVTFLILRSDC